MVDVGALGARERMGLVDRPTGRPWQRTHCQNPFAQRLAANRFRIHIAGRDERNRSRGTWVEATVDAGGVRSYARAEAPSLDIGSLGGFDETGAMPGSLVEIEGAHRLYFTGWTLAASVPFQFEIGSAISVDGGRTFTREWRGPVLGRNRFDPFMVGAPWVVRENGDFRMWYASGTAWVRRDDGRPLQYYTIKHAWSADGLRWETTDEVCLPYAENEHAIARPVVVRSGTRYVMFYTSRRVSSTYRIHRAESDDGLRWRRDAQPFLDVGDAAWENEMVCYGAPVIADEAAYLLYNGNAYGADGFGAVRLTGRS